LIDSLAESEGVSMAEVVRRALDAYLSGEVDPGEALQATFDAAPDLAVPSRDEWSRG
jgi:hypothetical protein